MKKSICAAAMAVAALSANAGGLLTNTNQNIAFVRNPARDAAIGIDGVYSNPAGVAFLEDGLHLSLNIQNAHQTRTVETGFPLFVYNMDQPGNQVHKFEGEVNVPVIPSLMAAYNTGRWSFQFGFAITGGGGKCAFEDGLGSFEQVVSGSIYNLVNNPAIKPVLQAAGHEMGNGYAYDSYMRGKQYYFGFTAGSAYKLTENLSVYGGLRVLYGSANYYGYLSNIQVQCMQPDGSYTMENASNHFSDIAEDLLQKAGAAQAAADKYAADGMNDAADGMNDAAAKYAATATQLKAAAAGADQVAMQTGDITLNCDQTGVGIAPIIGIDYKLGKFNFAAKYEFKTRMRLKNKSANSESAATVPMLKKYADGEIVPEDSPAMLTAGVQYEITPNIRAMIGWHHYFDVDTRQYTNSMLGDTNEYLIGAEWDINKIIQISAGGQRTQYALKDAAMSDISFNTSSYTFGFGVGVNVAKNVKINAGYFQTLYDKYEMTSGTAPMVKTDVFDRTNRVLGIGVDLKF